MEYSVLTARLNVRTLELLFKKELSFIAENVELFLNQQPEVVLAINSDTVIVSMMLAVRRMMHEAAKHDEQQRETERINAVSPESLAAASHRNY
jgi:hypothetical protein